MNDKKYILTGNTIEHKDRTLFQICALKNWGNVKAGDLGGYVESESNLSHYGEAWIYDKAKAYENAKIYGDASARGEAEIWGHGKVFGKASVSQSALVCGNAEVSEEAWIGGVGSEDDGALIMDYARIMGNACVVGNARVYDSALVNDSCYVTGDAQICGDTKLAGDLEIIGATYLNTSETINSHKQFIFIPKLGGYDLTITKEDIHIGPTSGINLTKLSSDSPFLLDFDNRAMKNWWVKYQTLIRSAYKSVTET